MCEKPGSHLLISRIFLGMILYTTTTFLKKTPGTHKKKKYSE